MCRSSIVPFGIVTHHGCHKIGALRLTRPSTQRHCLTILASTHRVGLIACIHRNNTSCCLQRTLHIRQVSARDKAINLVDEAASALRLAQESKPDELEALERKIMTLQIELESLKNEVDVFSVERRAKVEEGLRNKKKEAQELTTIWQNGAI
jgi:hypothetical protein